MGTGLPYLMVVHGNAGEDDDDLGNNNDDFGNNDDDLGIMMMTSFLWSTIGLKPVL